MNISKFGTTGSQSLSSSPHNNFIQFDNRRVFGSRLITLGLNSNGQHIASYSPINIRGSNMYGLETINRLPNSVFKIKNFSDNNASLELGDKLILKGVAYPNEPTDAATKEFVETKLQTVNLRSIANNAVTKQNLYQPKEELLS